MYLGQKIETSILKVIKFSCIQQMTHNLATELFSELNRSTQ